MLLIQGSAKASVCVADRAEWWNLKSACRSLKLLVIDNFTLQQPAARMCKLNDATH